MSNGFFENLTHALQTISWMEAVAVIAGIASVWFSKKESIWVYPVGLINTIIYTWISFDYHLPGEGAVNFYYTVMSIYGWYNWNKKNESAMHVVQITTSNRREWLEQLIFFVICYGLLFMALSQLQDLFFKEAIPWADALASAAAFTGMWLMTRKKVESWYWWILTNFASMPLYFVKGLPLTAVYYFVLLLIAFGGLQSWNKKALAHHA
jgi:nicotinamide mononucleotide transporter